MKKRGFTMVELMIVIAIISVLATIIIPKFSGARDKSKLEACKANIRHISIAMELYANDNNGAYTPCTTTTFTNYGNCGYLISGAYLKAAPVCPTGHGYVIVANHSGHDSAPNPCTLIYSAWSPGAHPAVRDGYDPYFWIGGGYVRER